MTSKYEPGTVAVATVRGVPNVRVWFYGSNLRWLSGYPIDGTRIHNDECVTDVRHLVMLDPASSPEPLNGATACLLDAAAEIVEAKVKRPVREVPFLRWIADQIEAQTKPSRIPEPTAPLSEVEASTHGRERRRFVRGIYSDARWIDGVSGWGWRELIDPVLVRDGIEGGAR